MEWNRAIDNEHTHSRFDRVCRLMVRYRPLVLATILIITAVLGCGIVRIRGEVLLYELFPIGHPYLQIIARFGNIFGGGGSGAVVAVNVKQGDIFNKDTLVKIQRITEEVSMWDEVYRVLTVSIASPSIKVVKAKGGGEIGIEPLMYPDVPGTPGEMEMLKKNLYSNPSYNGSLVSKDGKGCLIVTEFKEDVPYERSFALLTKIVKEYSDGNTSIHVSGFPMLMGWVYSYKKQIEVVFAVSILLMILLLYCIFRNLAGMLTPMAFACVVTVMGLGFIGWTGVNFSPLLYVLAFLVGARIVSHSVQITHRYFEEYERAGGDKAQACFQTMRTMIVPNIAAVATEVAGFLTLLLAKIILMMHVAIIMSFWMACISLCGIMTPILCTYMPGIGKASQKYAGQRAKDDLLGRIIVGVARWCIGSGKTIAVAVLIILIGLAAWQSSGLKIGDPTPGTSLLWPSHVFNRDTAAINKTFNASSENFVLYYEGSKGSVYDPVVLTTFEKFARHMEAQLPDIYKSSTSIINTVKMVNETFHDGDKMWHELPREKKLLEGLMGYVRQNTDTGTFARFADKGFERAQITLFFADHTTESLRRIKEAAYDFFKTHSWTTDKGRFILAGGRVGMEIAVNEEMKRAHVLIDAAVFIAIFVLCVLSYFSFTAGLMLTLPLLLANLVAFAYMALANIGLSVNTLPIAAISVGVGVDFAIFLYSRCKNEFPKQNGWESTVLESVRTCGKAIVYTGLTTILPILTWYFISDLKFQAQMGIFLALIMGVNVILALTLHPLMICMIRPRFISGVKEPARTNPEPAMLPESEHAPKG
ncbi:MAG: bifunctional preprotein translocase subunit SecD/SecF [Syntrophorhabdus sp. PtaU1.Bin058]|nr:MAG: bifunctional preprotein translocase subunit SecD/SecF [Syntrophorhabdus sp. PtaU1.Bin058]